MTTLARLSIVLLCSLASSVEAATLLVDTIVDDPALTSCDDATVSDCSLRGAITAANALAEPSTVVVPAGTYELTQIGTCIRKSPGGSTAPLSQVALCLTGQVTVQGAGAATTIIDGKGNHRDLFVSFGAVAEMRGVTLTRGLGEPLPEGGGVDGGGVRNLGTLTLTDSVVSNGALMAGFGGAGAPGIYNVGALTLLRSTVATNVTQAVGGGGGVYNAGADAVLTVIDSIIRDNTIPAIGGGIFNTAGAKAAVTGSTIVGNSALLSQGGGIYNDATLTLIDSTISGNESGSSGGGIANGQHGVADLNNVTITKNTSGTFAAGTGGGVATSSSSFTLRNTIVAGNTDMAGTPPHPDCEAPGSFGLPLTSQGYNLIGNPTGCSIVGDSTGNITGQDAKLGPLVDAGPTPTHALADDSPALEAGNPAPPGSGGTACAATDQRGFVRPIGGRCDIGAFERGGPFAVAKITPPVGGDIGSVTALVAGNGFVDGATVKLVRAGQADIVGAGPQVDAGASVITTTFDLAGKTRGAWDVIVTNPDTASQTLAGAFTIEVGRAPDPWVDIVGGVLFRHMRSPFTIFYGNRGNVDALAVPLTFNASGAYGLSRLFPITRPPALPESFREGIWDGVGITVAAGTADDFKNVSLLLPVIPPGFTSTLRIGLTLPPDPPDGTFFADIGAPFVTAAPDPQVVASMVAGARELSASVFGVTIPEALVPDVTQYVTAQLETLVTDGRNALIASVESSPHVYSLAQLQVDTAVFAAGRALAMQASAEATGVLATWTLAGRTLASWTSMLGPATAMAQKQNVPTCGQTGLIGEGGSCRTTDETIKPGTMDGNCNTQDMTQYLRGLGDRPDCTLSPPGCGVIGAATLVTLSDGSQLCRGPGCKSDSKYGECRDYPVTPTRAVDPNDKAGALGVGVPQFVRGDTPSTYVIHFENLDTATAPAAVVVVTDPLDSAHLDLDTFSLGPISFGPFTLVPSPGLDAFSGSVDLRPAQNIVITVDASLDSQTGIVTWRFDTIDQTTGQSTEDPSAGFLPPNVDPPAGEGLVSFSVRPKAGLAAGTAICNQASIVFDQNDPLATVSWCNTLDGTAPASQVDAAKDSLCTQALDVHWSGTDAGAGVVDYTIFVSENGGPATVWLAHTVETEATFPGQLGTSYGFYSVAVDGVGNVEPAPAVPDVVTTPSTACCLTDAECDDANVCNGTEACDTGAMVCLAGATLACDDGDPCTSDGCNPATGCTHAPIVPCPATCALECPDGDPCTTDTCVGGACQRTDLTGVPGARCVCERASVEACAADTIPSKIAKKATAACRALDRAAGSAKAKARKKLLKKAAGAWKALAKLVAKPAAQRTLSEGCVAGLKDAYGDAAGRADRAVLAP